VAYSSNGSAANSDQLSCADSTWLGRLASGSCNPRRIVSACGGTVACAGLLFLAGWILPASWSIWIARIRYHEVLPGTAAGLFILGMHLASTVWECQPTWWRRIAVPATVIVTVDGLLVFLGAFAGVELSPATILLQCVPGWGSAPKLGVSPLIGLILCLSGLAILAQAGGRQAVGGSSRDWRGLSSLLGGLVLAGGLVLVLSCLYNAPLTADGRAITGVLAASMLLGLGVMAAAGADAIPLRPLAGVSIGAQILRLYVVLIVSILLAHGLMRSVVPDPSGQVSTALSMLLSGALVTVLVVASWRLVRASHREAAESLRRGEEQYRSLVENLNDVVFTLDTQGRFTYVSPVMERLTSYRVEELEGQPWARFIHPDDLPGLAASVARTLVGAMESYEFRLRTKEGDWRDVRSSGRARYHDGQLVGITGVAMDITLQKRAEEELRKTQHRLEGIVRSDIIGITVSLDGGQLVEANDYYLRLIGLSREQLLSGSVDWRRITRPDHIQRDEAAIAEVRRVGICTPYEKEYLLPDGGGVWVLIGLACLPGQPEQIAGFVLDITDRKRAEEALQTSEEQLRQAQKMEAIGLLAGGIAHDFRNQLTVIKGYSEMLLRRDMVDGPSREHIQEILKAANRSATLTGELLAFGRKQTLRPEVVNLCDLVAETAKPLRAMLGEDVRLSIVAAQDVANVRIDPGQFQQALVNLAANARDAMPEGGELWVETASVLLDDHFARQHPGASVGPHVVATIRDSGTGMDEETLSRVFEPFFTTKPIGQGTGLGLSMVYGFVKQSGGTIDVCSRPGKGTTFRLYFPQARANCEAAMAQSPGAPLPHGTGTILVVEDEDPIRRLIVNTLQECGYCVLQAADAQQADLCVFRHNGTIDLLVTDVVMPGGSGPELARRMRSQCPGLRVLYVSGYTGRALSQRGIEGEEADVIVKPFNSQRIIDAVRSALGEEVSSTK
jgi:PAS domain S-box-containing protein